MFNALRSSCELLGQVIGELYGTECKLLETASKETVINSNYSYYDILVSPSCLPLSWPLTQLCCCRSESLGERPGWSAPVSGMWARDEE